MADTALPVVKAMIAALKAAPGIAGLVGPRIYTDVPQDEPFPYIVVSLTSEPFAANDFSGQTHLVRAQAFSREATIEECLRLRAAVMDTLDRKEGRLILDAGMLVKCEYSGGDRPFIEDDGKTWQSVAEFEVIVV